MFQFVPIFIGVALTYVIAFYAFYVFNDGASRAKFVTGMALFGIIVYGISLLFLYSYSSFIFLIVLSSLLMMNMLNLTFFIHGKIE